MILVNTHCSANSAYLAAVLSMIVTSAKSTPYAMREPMATVTIQSKLFIWEVDRFPKMRTDITTAEYIMKAENAGFCRKAFVT